MRPLPLFLLLELLLVGCQSTWGTLLVRIELPADVVTQCVSVTAGAGRPPLLVPRNGKNLLLVAINESADLTGDVAITLLRYAREDCSVPVGTPQRKTALLRLNRQATLTFAFDDDGGADGGVDGGSDGGADGGCELARCPEPPACGLMAVSCLDDERCEYSAAPKGASCDGGLCDGTGVCRSQCQVLDEGAPCDDGLSCTRDRCVGGLCVGECINAPSSCQAAKLVCASDTECQLEAVPDNTLCVLAGVDGGREKCRTGLCEQTLPYAPRNLDDQITAYPPPTGTWQLEPGCITVIDTGLSPPAPLDGGWCSATAPSVRSKALAHDGGEAAIFSMWGLDIPEGAEVHFVGARPVVLVVVGEATISGVLSVAPKMGLAPAGSNPLECALHHAHVDALSSSGAGGAAFGASAGSGGSPLDAGGVGGESWGDDSLEPLRGGCRGGTSLNGGTGGRGGGAIQLSVAGRLLIADGGVVTASGGGGRGGPSRFHGGGGGGSGGAVLLEAGVLIQLGFITANGGGGGEGSDAVTGAPGANGALRSLDPAPGGSTSSGGAGGVGGAGASKGGTDGLSTSLSGGGGGGSVGRLRLRAMDAAGSQTTIERLSGQLRLE